MRRLATWTLAAGAALLILTVAFCAALDAGYGHSLLVRLIASRLDRPVRVNGPLRVHLLARHPELTAEGVVIGNPPWVPPGTAAEVGKVTSTLSWPRWGLSFGVESLSLEAASLNLERDAVGRANWQLTAPDKPKSRAGPIIHALAMRDARVTLRDARRQLQFAGTVSARAVEAGQPLRIEGSGQLNGRAASVAISADPLATANRGMPYHFSFSERSSGSRLEARGWLQRPFDFDAVDAGFEATGPDLKDLYFLTGVRLLDTGAYHLSGKASRRGARTDYSDLVVTSGQSDVRGTVSIDSSGTRKKFVLDLKSDVLRSADLGLRAAGRTSAPLPPLVLSDAKLNPHVVRIGDATIRFRARQLDLGRLSLHEVSARATTEQGVLTVAPLRAEMFGGTVTGRLVFDARRATPAAHVDLGITDLQLGLLPHKQGAPPVEGPLQVQVKVTGSGRSLHEVAASANGTVRAQLPHGAMRASLAEFSSGADLRGLRLMLTHNQKDVEVRCAVAEFKADGGTLVAQDMIADTDPALITGEGRVQLDTETLDLVIRGRPKSLRWLRLRAPVLVQGTLAHPSVSMQRSKATPLIVETAKARDTDCAALLTPAGPVAP